MDTVGRSSVVPVEQVYDGFISYSHAADDLLAPRLQSALQRFAKPWWKRRAVRIFRDESSLSANPHLWSSITEALDSSGWFVLLLSPDAASSEWVNQEIAYWVEHRDPKKILPVVTDGEFGWAHGDVSGDAAPEALRGVFSEEPRWVDLRFARDEQQLDLQDPRFADAVADIASTIRGIPKDELAPEEVRQHRRAIRTAWIGGVALAALTVAAVWAAVFALGQQTEAERQAQLAGEQAEIAQQERDVAQEERGRADQQALNAEARRLTAEAARVLDRDVQLAMLLLLEAFSVAVDEELKGEIAVAARVAAEENRLLKRFDATQWSGTPQSSVGRLTTDNRAVLSPDATTIYHITRETNSFVAFEVDDEEERWEWAPEIGEQLWSVSVSPDGATVALSVFGGAGEPGRLVIFDASTGDLEAEIPTAGCRYVAPVGPGFSPDGEWFSIRSGSSDCGDSRRRDVVDWASVYDTSTWQEGVRHAEPGGRAERIWLSGGGGPALIAFESDQGVQTGRLVTFPDLGPVEEFGIRWPSLSPDGGTIAYTASGETFVRRSIPGYEIPLEFAYVFTSVRAGFNSSVEELGFGLGDSTWPFSFSPDGSLMAVVSEGSDAVLDVSNGAVVLQLYELVDTFDASWSEDGTLLLTSHPTELLLWSIVPVRIPNEVLASRDWIGYAQDSLVRSFTVTECAEFMIDPCPSLEEIQSR